jgi:hypothetical protein
MKLKLTSDS